MSTENLNPDRELESIQSELELEAEPSHDGLDGREAPPAQTEEERARDEEATANVIRGSLVQLGSIDFDAGAADNASAGVKVPAERRKHFRRDVYVGIRDSEQDIEFLGRVVEGPFHAPHEISPDSAITRTTVLYPERTKFRNRPTTLI